MQRGDLWWADLPEPTGAGPGYRRPVLLIQADVFTRSRIATVIAIVVTSNLRLATAPGNVLVRASEAGLPKDSVVNVSQVITLDKTMIDEYIIEVWTELLNDSEGQGYSFESEEEFDGSVQAYLAEGWQSMRGIQPNIRYQGGKTTT